MANFSSVLTMKRLFVAAAVCLGWLLQSNAELLAVGNCSFMQYYCNVREYETSFFKRLYKDPTADCGLHFWILYYKVLKESDKCQPTHDHMKSLKVAKIREIQTLYCSGLDLERPLMLSLSPCSDKHKQEVITCINDFAKTFSSDFSESSLCRKRDKAKQCTIYSWRTHCNHSDVADGILKRVIGSFNPFCDGDKDPKAVETDQCANYAKPLDFESCPLPSWLLQSNAEQLVGNCSFMEYYCNVREYETWFFKRLYKDPAADCGLHFWILYYKVLKESDKCQTTHDHMKSLTAAKIREIQTLYCSGLDLERPLMLSLSPCSDKHKQEVITCINDFAETFSRDFSDPSLCRKRDEAKRCTIYSWRTYCNQSDVADGILEKVIGSFNPFCEGDKDPKAVETDQCANYTKPLDHESSPLPSTTSRAPGSSDEDGLSGGEIAGIVIGALVGSILLCIIYRRCRSCCGDDDD